ncbi:MAG: hypothetical protein N3A61_02735 [Ignavibacteria bacterium]|nr:hypothetical protein [Ignavibacteria bacterium]
MTRKAKRLKDKSNITTLASPSKNNEIFDKVLLLAFLIFICLFSTFKISGDDDVFWHLATGRYIVETKSIPSTDIFGFASADEQWIPFEWGWDVLTYIIFQIAGFTGLSVFRTMIFVLIFLIYFLILKKLNVGTNIIFLIFIIMSFGIMDRLTPRPHIISFLFFVQLLFILFNFKYLNRRNFKILYFIPLIFLLWGNMHMGVLGGLFLFLIFVLSELITYLKPAKFSSKNLEPISKSQLQKIILIFCISVVMLLLNPHFIETYIYAYNHTKMKLLETVNEWRSPFDPMYGKGFVNLIYKIFLFGGIITIFYSFKTKDLFFSLVYLGFVIYSIRAMRFTVDYIIVIALFFIISINFILQQFRNKSLVNFFSHTSPLKVIMIIILSLFSILLPGDKLYLEYLKYYRVFGIGVDSNFLPVQLFDFMKQTKIAEIGNKPLNHFGCGGFLVWNFPHTKNFIDSRNLNDKIFYEYYSIITMNSGFDKKLENYGFDYSIYLAPDLVRIPEEMERTIISHFSRDTTNWALVFWDDKSFLWLKRIPKFNEIISKYEYKYVSPFISLYMKEVLDDGLRKDKDLVLSEIKRKLNEEPQGVIINSIANYVLK